MKKKVINKGDRVGHATYVIEDNYGDSKIVKGLRYSEYCEDPDYGTVTDILSSGEVMINWDSSWKNSNNKPVAQDELMLESDIEKEFSKLENQFKLVQKQIKIKMKEAGKLITEANKLAKKTGNNLQKMYDAVQPLENAMDKAGWNTSSWGC
jgi:hypothetical protein